MCHFVFTWETGADQGVTHANTNQLSKNVFKIVHWMFIELKVKLTILERIVNFTFINFN